jgi:midasin (ATPase involved in ribosome maturation)
LEQLSGEPKENEDDDENNAGMDPDIEDLMRDLKNAFDQVKI